MSDAIKSLRPIGIAMFAILVGPLLQSDSQVSAQDCHTCTMPCPYDGFYCEPNGRVATADAPLAMIGVLGG